MLARHREQLPSLVKPILLLGAVEICKLCSYDTTHIFNIKTSSPTERGEQARRSSSADCKKLNVEERSEMLDLLLKLAVASNLME